MPLLLRAARPARPGGRGAWTLARTGAPAHRRGRYLRRHSSREQDAEITEQTVQRYGRLGAEGREMSGPWRASLESHCPSAKLVGERRSLYLGKC